jgi:hypothetical protein
MGVETTSSAMSEADQMQTPRPLLADAAPGLHGSLQPPAGEWTILRLAAADFVPTWHGRVLDHLSPPDPSRARQVGLLIADRQWGPFKLDLRTIELVC